MSDLSIEQRVAAGATWLDLNAPGWLAQIDLSSLDIEEPCNCVLGQVYGHYFSAPASARYADAGEGYSYLADDRGFNGPEEDMPALNSAWSVLIGDRRAAQ